ncbi:MAG: hypothetical protein A3B37_02020 [Candidatus Sungbacteria bacterium RIFCSPLOWO2_01_FULL_59_16]|uniref:CusB-like beta-barrel domain-containing protein n=1 Tax=Candidatus Sungbacteria bacterium RIFCSPLOWO2_01_FULL_59_16 TaxID=1802280 RepID=A0A1G2LCW3_9BACT|nr:MAG: hypothetical protein A3B37_02020 [Candidatus Sungbacteria bacterium RIFCSPLOWO2_01_FULL_59_16]
MNFFRKPIVIALLAALVLAGGGFLYFGRSSEERYEIFTARRGNLVQEVSVTGQVRSAERVDLAFERSGRVSRVAVAIGERVSGGQTLIALENADLAATLAEAEASVKVEQANLAELRRGTRPEEIAVEEADVRLARQALFAALFDAYTTADDAVRNRADQFFSSPQSANPQINFAVTDPRLESNIESMRFALEGRLTAWRAALDDLSAESDLDAAAAAAAEHLGAVRDFLELAVLALNDVRPTAALSQTTIDGYKSAISTARSNITGVVADLSAAESKLFVEERELVLKRAGATLEELAAQEARLEQARAKAANAEAELAKTILRAPFAGVVVKQEADVGEIFPANEPAVSLTAASRFKIEAFIPEADFAKVAVGHPARVTLDAYGEEVLFEASVAAVDPAETMIEGVATYKATLQFAREDGRLRPGMTANIDIITAERESVIFVPHRAVITRDGATFIRAIEGEAIRELPVRTGIGGSDGLIEISEGLREGDQVVVFTKGE